MLGLMRHGPTFQPGLSPGEHCHSVLPKSQLGPGSGQQTWVSRAILHSGWSGGEGKLGWEGPASDSPQERRWPLGSRHSPALAQGKPPHLLSVSVSPPVKETPSYRPLQAASIAGGDLRRLGVRGGGRPQP